MNLSQQEVNMAAERVARDWLEKLSVHDIHELIEPYYGAVSDNQAYEILEYASNARVTA
jgi:hypothetical protein